MIDEARGIVDLSSVPLTGEDGLGTTDAQRTIRPLGVLAAIWGLLGVSCLLLNAAGRLLPLAIEGLTAHAIAPWQWAITVGWVGTMAWSEGYRGFQQGFSPRVVARALHLAAHPRPLHVALAPLFCMGLIHASRRRLVASWILVAAIVAMVTAVRLVPQPWRGIVDAGVVVGLGWGLVATLAFAVRALLGRPPRVPLELS